MIKKLLKVKKKISGRNNTGVISIRHRGGGFRLKYRFIDFKRSIFEIPAVVLNIEYDPNRTSLIALILYKNGILSYIISPNSLKKGDIIKTSQYSSSSIIGNCIPMQSISLGSILNNIELHYGKGGQFCRSAGIFGVLLAKQNLKNNIFVIIRLYSKEEYIIFGNNLASIGVVSNLDYYLKNLKKAGKSRHLGIRPKVRGVAMNPIDHPHGGGEGKTSGGRPSVSLWGKLTKGKPTRKKKKKIFLFLNQEKKLNKCFFVFKKII